MWPNPQAPADLVTFSEEILNEKASFCAVGLAKLTSAILSAEWSEDKPHNVCLPGVTYFPYGKVFVIQKYSVNAYSLN